MTAAFRYIGKNGITTEDKYPYTAKNGLCKFNGGDFKIADFTEVSSG